MRHPINPKAGTAPAAAPAPGKEKGPKDFDILKATFCVPKPSGSQFAPVATTTLDQALDDVTRRTKEVTTSSSSSDSSDSDEFVLVPTEPTYEEAMPLPPPAPLSSSNTFTITVNDEVVTTCGVDPRLTLAQFLRENLGRKGTKIGCAEGGCGACTVLLEYPNDNRPTRAVNSCLCPVAGLDGCRVVTVEGLGSKREGFSKVMETLAAKNGTQCGYCTPGWVVNMTGLLNETEKPPAMEIEKRFDGNLCRCTGYRPILNAFQSFSAESQCRSQAGCSEGTCPTERDLEDMDTAHCHKHETKADGEVTREWPLFTPAPKDRGQISYQDEPEPSKSDGVDLLRYEDPHDRVRWYNVETIEQVKSVVAHYQGKATFRFVAGNTSIGVTKYFEPAPVDSARVLIDTRRVSSLVHATQAKDGTIEFGSGTTLEMVLSFLQSLKQTDTIEAVVGHIYRIANTQVRNLATWTGNLMLCKSHPDFPSDLVLLLIGLNARLKVLMLDGSNKEVEVAPLEFIRDNKTYTMSNCFVLSVVIPPTPDDGSFDSFKVSLRKQNSHALVNMAGTVVSNSAHKVTSATLVIAGAGMPHTLLPKVTAALVGSCVTDPDTLKAAMGALAEEVKAASSPSPLVSDDYRISLASSLLYKYLLRLQGRLPARLRSAIDALERPVSFGKETFSAPTKDKPLSQPIPKITAATQASGEVTYTTDVPTPANCLHAAYVTSTQAKAKIVSIDASDALSYPGVVKFMSAEDIKGQFKNDCGFFPGDEEIFASTEVGCVGQAIGMVLADSDWAAQRAAAKVKVTYSTDGMDPPIFDIKTAVAKGSVFKNSEQAQHMEKLEKGDVEAGFKKAKKIIEGDIVTPAQFHMYMETQNSLVIPTEDGGVQVYSSAQGATDTQAKIMGATGLPANNVVVQVNSVGGAFGGKLSRNQPLACALSIAALQLRRPVRGVMDRRADMNMWAKRDPITAHYKCGVDDDGKVEALHVQFYSDAGYTLDLSFGGMDMCQLWADNLFCIDNYLSEGIVCRTNLPSCTSMRAPGAFNSTFVSEELMRRIAHAVKKPHQEVAARNYYKVGDVTPYGQTIKTWHFNRVWDKLNAIVSHDARRAAVDQFNAVNRWKKRGMARMGVKYGMAIPGNMHGVTINVYQEDGTVRISSGGCEIGQGLNTKVAQAAAYALGIDIETITVSFNSTDKVPNTTLTGGSAASETCVAACLVACKNFNEQTAEFRKTLKPGTPWAEFAAQAGANGVPLTAHGWYSASPDPDKPVFSYYVYASCHSEVEVDVLSGENHILHSEIVYDCGESLNPAIDIGQIQGGFMQGVGYFTTERVVTDDQGRNVSEGTWEYKPPFSQDIPVEFNVTMLKDVYNPSGIHGSKATGEPPYALSATVYYALKDAISAARAEIGQADEYVDVAPPLTPEAIQRACRVDASQYSLK